MHAPQLNSGCSHLIGCLQNLKENAEKEFDTAPVRYDTLRLYMRLCSIRGICDRLGEGSELYRYCFMVDTDVLTSVQERNHWQRAQ